MEIKETIIIEGMVCNGFRGYLVGDDTIEDISNFIINKFEEKNIKITIEEVEKWKRIIWVF